MCPSVTLTLVVEVGGVNPVVTCSCIEDSVVATTGTITAPPVGEVQHSLEVCAELIATALVVYGVVFLKFTIPANESVIVEALNLGEVETSTETEDG